MALKVNFYNDFDDTEAHVAFPNDQNQEVNPKAYANPPITLENGDSGSIWAEGKDCQIRVAATGSNYPEIGINLTDSTWGFNNIGTNTEVQVEVGPDGQ